MWKKAEELLKLLLHSPEFISLFLPHKCTYTQTHTPAHTRIHIQWVISIKTAIYYTNRSEESAVFKTTLRRANDHPASQVHQWWQHWNWHGVLHSLLGHLLVDWPVTAVLFALRKVERRTERVCVWVTSLQFKFVCRKRGRLSLQS